MVVPTRKNAGFLSEHPKFGKTNMRTPRIVFSGFFWFFLWNFCHPLRKKMGGNTNYFSAVTRPNLWLARKLWVLLTLNKFCELVGTHPAGAPFPLDLRSRANSSILAARWKHLAFHKPWRMIPRISSGALAHHQCISLLWFHYTMSYNNLLIQVLQLPYRLFQQTTQQSTLNH